MGSGAIGTRGRNVDEECLCRFERIVGVGPCFYHSVVGESEIIILFPFSNFLKQHSIFLKASFKSLWVLGFRDTPATHAVILCRQVLSQLAVWFDLLGEKQLELLSPFL